MNRIHPVAGDAWVDSLGRSLRDSYAPEKRDIRVYGRRYDSLMVLLAVASKSSPETIRKDTIDLVERLGDYLLKEPPRMHTKVDTEAEKTSPP